MQYKITEDELVGMIALRDMGLSCKKISEKLNIPEPTVYYYVGKKGYKNKNKNRKHGSDEISR